MSRFLIPVLGLGLLSQSLPGAAGGPVWPTPGTAFEKGRPYADFVQATASGEPESALFGCVRNDGRRFHEGIDIAPVQPRKNGEATDPVLAIHDGFVTHINGVAGNSSYGRYVVLEHPDQSPAIYSLYAHLADVEKDLEVGDFVAAGSRLGTMGRSAAGYVIPRSRAHVHLEIGLRLSEGFQEWYDRQAYSSPNFHDNFNGINLVGLDPLDYFRAFREGRAGSTLEYFNQIPPAVRIHVLTWRFPDFLERYPGLALPGCPEEERAGWEVMLSAWGMPLSLRPLRREELRGVSQRGEISVVGMNQELLEEFGCRDVVTGTSQFKLGTSSRRNLELLFMPD